MADWLPRSVVPLYLLLCLFMGGSTRGEWSNLVLQLGAIAILAAGASTRPRTRTGLPGRMLAALMAAVLAVVIAQVVPLPPELWSSLPGRDAIAHGFELLQQPQPWLPISLAPYDTMASALWLLPPFAVIVGMLRLGAYRQSWLAIALAVGTMTGIVLGALQAISPDPTQSSWYLYSVTNHGRAVGLFANSNHMATLLVVTIPFIVAMYGAHSASRRSLQSSVGRLVILGCALFAVLAGIALNGSLAGIGLAIPVLALSLFIFSRADRRITQWGLFAAFLIGSLSVAAVFASPFQNNLTSAKSDEDYSSRYTTFSNGLNAAADYFPVGSGIGTFADIYPSYERTEVADRWFVNHVHNDYIELAIETGILGILLLLCFFLWWSGRAVAVWRTPSVNPYARAASIASGAILAHSLVDFPLRMSAIAAVFAMCIALMAGPRPRTRYAVLIETDVKHRPGRARHLSID